MLTDAAIRSARPSDKTGKLFDGGGLYLELAKEARQARDRARKQLQEGTDPSASRKAAKAALRKARQLTVEKVALEWLEHRSGAWKKGTRHMVEASLRNDVFPTLGVRPIGDLQPRDIRDLVKGIEARGAGETAGRVFQRLGAIYRYAVAHELTSVDPTYALKPSEIFKPRKAKHRGSIAEADMPEFFRRLDQYEGDPSTRSALELLLLTATRPGELRGARWDEIDEAASLWRIAASRMKMGTEHLVPLSRQALEVLQSMRRACKPGELVFPSPFYPGKPLSDGTLNSALARLGYKGIATAHGFRTLFSTCSNEAGCPRCRAHSLIRSRFCAPWWQLSINARPARDEGGGSFGREAVLQPGSRVSAAASGSVRARGRLGAHAIIPPPSPSR